eukprot:CAMPEP_0167755488 /NCGR_PEP_ID=MMETSP0110_2-20121227/8854_1 /TAXON_ID=629695 /ORGANISM="Gymnochlora sp., Strain CCMP2014" /LENGTH=293 /DNA_ID=CAMNT_0007641485 /DNA_START=288 /DNA_END=1169 /DNA_ORIENTATION=+
MDEIVFEKYGFKSYCRLPGPSMALYDAMRNHSKSLLSETYSVVVDVGYSATHVVPFVEEMPVNHAIKRVNVGGKLLTNYLKEVVSYRAFSMMDETYLMDHIKRKVCLTSTDFKADLKASKLSKKKNPFRLEYVLPNHSGGSLGFVRGKESKATEDEQVLTLSNERITVPELLFSPKILGLQQGGIAEAIAESIKACHPDLHGLLYNNIIVVGGSSSFPNFLERLRTDVRSLIPTRFKLNIRGGNESKIDPKLSAWMGGSEIVTSGAYEHYKITKKVYAEYGSEACKRKFYWYT